MSQRCDVSVRVALCAAVLGCVQAAAAQPVVDGDLGRFDNVADRSVQQLVIVTPANPVRWYTVTLPRVADPHRLLDIFTWNATAYDTEIGLFAADGTLIATDDDDGAEYFSALTFGITDTAAPGRVQPVTSPGQTTALLNNGRDGVISGPSTGPTTATYYIAVTEYDATFANNFSVTRTGAMTGGLATLAVNFRTPSGLLPTRITRFFINNFFFANVSQQVVMTVETADQPAQSVVVYSPELHLNASLPQVSPTRWDAMGGYTAPGVGTYIARARVTNVMGDVVEAERSVPVIPANSFCGDNTSAPFRIGTVPGTTTYTYTTTGGGVEVNWAGCTPFNPSGDDVWFRWTPTMSGTAILSTCNSDTGVTTPQPDTLLGIRETCGSNFLACGDDTPGCDVGTRLSNIPIVAGQEYNIAIRAYDTPIVNGTLAVIFTPGCDSIDFNGDGLFPDTDDIADFIAVFGGGACPTGTCGDIDFNNDGLFPDTDDITALIRVFGGGACGG